MFFVTNFACLTLIAVPCHMGLDIGFKHPLHNFLVNKWLLLSYTDLVRYALHCSKSWFLAHITPWQHPLCPWYGSSLLSNWIVSVLNHLSLLLKKFLSVLSVCWSTASRDYNGSLTSSVSSSTNLMKSAWSGSLSWLFRVNCTLLFHLLPTDIDSFEIKVQSISGLLNSSSFCHQLDFDIWDRS